MALELVEANSSLAELFACGKGGGKNRLGRHRRKFRHEVAPGGSFFRRELLPASGVPEKAGAFLTRHVGETLERLNAFKAISRREARECIERLLDFGALRFRKIVERLKLISFRHLKEIGDVERQPRRTAIVPASEMLIQTGRKR